MKKNPGRKERRRLAKQNSKKEGKARARMNEIEQKKKAQAKKRRKGKENV